MAIGSGKFRDAGSISLDPQRRCENASASPSGSATGMTGVPRLNEIFQSATGVAPLTALTISLMVFCSSFMRGLTGFGMAIMLVPMLALVIVPERAVLLAILMGALIGPLSYRGSWQLTDKRVFWLLTGTAVTTTPVGLFLLARTAPDISRSVIAAIAIVAFFVLARRRAAVPPRGAPAIMLTGAVAGFLGSFAAMPGPPVVFYFVRDSVAPSVARASMNVIFCWGALATALVAFVGGRLDFSLVGLALFSVPALVAGNRVGEHFFGVIEEATWRMTIMALIGVSALGALLRLFGV